MDYHTTFFEEWQYVWNHIKTTNAIGFDSFLATVVADLVKMNSHYHKGKNMYIHLLLHATIHSDKQ